MTNIFVSNICKEKKRRKCFKINHFDIIIPLNFPQMLCNFVKFKSLIYVKELDFLISAFVFISVFTSNKKKIFVKNCNIKHISLQTINIYIYIYKNSFFILFS